MVYGYTVKIIGGGTKIFTAQLSVPLWKSKFHAWSASKLLKHVLDDL